jgi:hypothetical protein
MEQLKENIDSAKVQPNVLKFWQQLEVVQSPLF